MTAINPTTLNVAELKTYLSTTLGTVPTDAVLLSVLKTEAADQGLRIKASVMAADQPQLVEALYRRCARNLAQRRIPLGISDNEAGGLHVFARDSEVRRLEGPFRKLVLG